MKTYALADLIKLVQDKEKCTLAEATAAVTALLAAPEGMTKRENMGALLLAGLLSNPGLVERQLATIQAGNPNLTPVGHARLLERAMAALAVSEADCLIEALYK